MKKIFFSKVPQEPFCSTSNRLQRSVDFYEDEDVHWREFVLEGIVCPVNFHTTCSKSFAPIVMKIKRSHKT